MGRKLDEIIEEFDSLRESFSTFRTRKEVTKDALIEFEFRLVDLRADLRPHRKTVAGSWQKRDDKAATGIKFRIALAIHEGAYKDKDGALMYDKCSINAAEKFASGSKAYKAFLEERSFYKEALVNLTDLRNDIDGYINLIKDMLKAI